MRQIAQLDEGMLKRIVSETIRNYVNESFRGEIGLKNLGQDSEQYIALQNAKIMQQNNESPLKIKQTTGWEIGYDGKWKYEGVDGHVKKMPIEQIHVLGDIWDDDDLYRWYPQLKNVKIVWKIKFNDADYASSTPTSIEIPKSLIWWDKANRENLPIQFMMQSTEKTIQHEIQHVIQSIESWDSGRPSPDYSKHQEIILNLQKQLSLAEKYANITPQECYHLYKKTTKNSIEKAFFVDLLGYLRQGYTTNDYIEDLKQQISNFPSFDDLEQEYYNANGEREAYEVNNRYGWNYDKRRNTLMSN